MSEPQKNEFICSFILYFFNTYIYLSIKCKGTWTRKGGEYQARNWK